MARLGESFVTANCRGIALGDSVVGRIVAVRTLGGSNALPVLCSGTLLFVPVFSDGAARCAQRISLCTGNSEVGHGMGHVYSERVDGLVTACRASQSLETSQILYGGR